MKQLTNFLSNLLRRKYSINLEYVFIKSFKINKILNRAILIGIMLFGFTGFSLGQTSAFNTPSHKKSMMNQNSALNSATYKKDLLKDKREISAKLRTEKQELHQVKKIINEISYTPSTSMFEKFKMNFPKAQKVTWLPTDGYVEADYTMNKSKMATFYDLNNTLIGTAKYIAYKSLPAKGRKDIARHYKGFVPEKAMYFDDNDQNTTNMNFFGSDIDQDDYYVLLENKKNDKKEIVLQVTPHGSVSYFSEVK
ncbi:MAG: hypothetical protein KGM16_10925 [Bacteroidota bacterium]|nr:hypothetical protein [Bacteroidota bacterium]